MNLSRGDRYSFGSLLRTFRRRRHLTQQQLATMIGVHRNAIGRWEQGSVLPASKSIVLELARHLYLDNEEAHRLLEASLTATTPYWLVPFQRNSFFTGRETILEALHATLQTDQVVALTQSYALHGLGGVGKTQIALEYAYQHGLEYSAIFWIGAETEELIAASFLRIAEVLQLPERDDKDQQLLIAAVQRWLVAHSQWLLIWDNIEDLSLLDYFLPSMRQGAILLTTRGQTLGTRTQGLNLPPMALEEGTLFLLRRAKVLAAKATSEQVRQFAIEMPSQYATATKLADAMGGLPLALDQAGAYIEETRCSITSYLELFRTRSADLLRQRGEIPHNHPESVATTFTLAISATSEGHPAVEELLRLCALLQPDAIPEELFLQGGSYLGPILETVCRDTLAWNRAVGVACAYSLLYRQPEDQTLSLHRMVQAVLLDAMTEAERNQWTLRAIEALNEAFPEMQPGAEYATLKRGERLLPHVQICLHRAGLTSESLALASLAYKTGQYLRERGQYDQAEPFYQRSLYIREQILGPDHPEMTLPLNYLAVLYWEQGKYALAEPLLQRAIQIWEQAMGPDYLEVARPINNLANLYWSQGRYAEAEVLHQRALSIWEQNLGPDHLDVTSSLNNLASIYGEQGKYAEAEPLLQRAVGIQEQALGPDHPLVAYSINNLAVLYTEQGKYAQAEQLHQRAVQIREQVLGPEHPLVAFSLHNLAELYTEQGKYAQAEQLHQRAARIREQVLGPEHPLLALSLNGLATLYEERGEYTLAEPLYQRTLRIREHALGPNHSLVAEPLNGLANFAREQADYAQAELLYQRAHAIREQALGQQHPETAQTLHDLAILRQKQGQSSEAILLARRALDIRTTSLGEAHPKTIATRTLYTKLVQEQERP